MLKDSKHSLNIKTFGCKVNTYDTGLLESRFTKAGYLLKDQSHIHVLNTCAVTDEATQEAIRTIRKIKTKDPGSVVVVTGCAAQVDTDKFRNISGADLVVANSHKGQLEELISKHLRGELTEKIFKSNIFKKDDLEEGGGREEGHTRAFLKIQDGCNSFCTFCVIPFARGKSRSLTIEAIRTRVKDLLAQGVREIVLTGVHIGDYEFGLENLIEDILLNTRVPRLRLTSLEPIEISDRLFDLFIDPRLCPHFHMSIQSSTTSVLTGMKRKYGSREVESSLNEIAKRVPNAFVGMDVICGFPGEGEDEFLDTYSRLSNLPWTRIHVFPYSERPGTYAMKLDGQNERTVVSRRSQRLRELSHKRYLDQALKQIGLKKKVLVLKNGRGLARDYWPVVVEGLSGSDSHNEEILVEITGIYSGSPGRAELPLTGRISDIHSNL
ncbi:MAG: tRNA (N(6)-L-threonylcarbamoyladenosine(37)-C(2))-methylthiotransferase MtaB [Bdellovibrionales bacterium]|nr:tRNA (N(6)-L-threonylcarbamoyladenosine(37)-C(2))-methylthiotransferase MtaB [Bdellovibrionales bacterium]